MASQASDSPRVAPTLLKLALGTGLSAFGGGFAIIARIRQRVVDELGWLSADEFTELMAVTAALPGTNAANLLTILGARRAGPAVATLACGLFLLPGVALMLAFGVFYDEVRSAPGIGGVLDGIAAAVAGIVAAVADDLRPTTLKRRLDGLVVVLAFAALATRVLGLLEVVALCALYGVIMGRAVKGDGSALTVMLVAAPPLTKTASIFASFAKVSLATFGGGVAMIPAVEHEVVARGWVQGPVFADAVAFAQVTPGPFAICSTFLGYRAGGFVGAAAATAGIFGPPLILSLVVADRLQALRENPTVKAILSGIAVAVVAALAAAAFSIYRVGVHGIAATLFAIGAFAWRRFRPQDSTLLVIAAGAAFGLVRAMLR